MMHRLNVFAMALLASVALMAQAEKAEYQDLFYNLDADRMEAEVAANPQASGEIMIPSQIRLGKDTYTVTGLSEKAFTGAKQVTGVVLPSTIERLYRSGLEKTGLYQNKANWKDGMLILDSILIAVDKNCKAKFVLPDEIRVIAAGAFANNKTITSVVFNSHISRIDHDLFRGCKNLVKVTIPENVKWIGEDAFTDTGIFLNPKKWRRGSLFIDGCLICVDNTAPAKYVFKTKVPTRLIASAAFAYMPQIETVVLPEGIEEIPSACFEECPMLREVTIPASVKRVEKYAFYNCANLESALLPDGVEYLGPGAFYQCGHLKEQHLGPAIEVLPKACFFLCRSIRRIELPQRLHTIGEGVFSGCNELEKLDLPASLRRIGDMAFAGCNRLRKVEIPAGVNSLPAKLFYQCAHLESVVLPYGLYAIGDEAFRDCVTLRRIEFPISTFRIGDRAFENCIELDKVQLVEHIQVIGAYAFASCKRIDRIAIPDKVEEINKGTFKDCISLEKVTLPASLKEIGDEAFMGCRHLKVSSLDIKPNVIVGGKNTFKDCKP